MPVISTNNAANAALNYLNLNSSKETNQLAQLASGSRIVQASDDAAGLAIGTQLNAGVTVYAQDSTNVQQGTQILQTADGALAQISNVLQRMMALATEAASGQVTNTQRSQDINTEYSQLKSEITSIVGSTTYAGQTLLSGSFLSQVKFLVGTLSSNFITISVTTVSVGGLLGTSGSTVSTATSALGRSTSSIRRSIPSPRTGPRSAPTSRSSVSAARTSPPTSRTSRPPPRWYSTPTSPRRRPCCQPMTSRPRLRSPP